MLNIKSHSFGVGQVSALAGFNHKRAAKSKLIDLLLLLLPLFAICRVRLRLVQYSQVQYGVVLDAGLMDIVFFSRSDILYTRARSPDSLWGFFLCVETSLSCSAPVTHGCFKQPLRDAHLFQLTCACQPHFVLSLRTNGLLQDLRRRPTSARAHHSQPRKLAPKQTSTSAHPTDPRIKIYPPCEESGNSGMGHA